MFTINLEDGREAPSKASVIRIVYRHFSLGLQNVLTFFDHLKSKDNFLGNFFIALHIYKSVNFISLSFFELRGIFRQLYTVLYHE